MPDPLLITERFRVEQVHQALSDGGTRTRAVVRHPGAVAIIPLVDSDHVCLIRNYRISVEETLVELPAGTLEPPDSPESTAHRELIEETGYRAQQLRELHSFYLSPGILDERMHLFLAEQLDFVGAQREPGEEIENLIVSWAEAIKLVHDGVIQDAKTIVGLLMYDAIRNA